MNYNKNKIIKELLKDTNKELTDEEFKTMKHHAVYTYYILSGIDDFEEIRDWAALHHEKLNGKDIMAVPLADEGEMRIGYITHRKGRRSQLGDSYLEALKKYLE